MLFLIFFPDIVSFQHVLHFGVGISQIEWKLKVKTEISVFPYRAKIWQNDHSNPYYNIIESTTILSDYSIVNESNYICQDESDADVSDAGR